MCGLTGLWQPGGCRVEEAQLLIHRMADTLTHRGSDDAGAWLDEPAGLALGHRRLAIFHLSSASHQPMVSVSGR
jgi:asparagine synthase (glutamine-hydrolysing)